MVQMKQFQFFFINVISTCTSLYPIYSTLDLLSHSHFISTLYADHVIHLHSQS